MNTSTSEIHSFFATCPRYVESILEEELRAIAPAATIRPTTGGVAFEAPLETALRVCLWSRVAGRVLLKLAEERVENRDGLYALARTVAWEDHFGLDDSFAVYGHSAHSAFTHSGLPFLVTKDAICDRFRARTNARPSVDTDSPDLRISLYLTERTAIIYLDLSGESLHRRSYRLHGGPAPLRENTAAAVLVRSGWDAEIRRMREGVAEPPVFVDPMCGSGTLAIEAALMAANVAPGLGRVESPRARIESPLARGEFQRDTGESPRARGRFGFERWAGHDPETWQALVEEARELREVGIARWVHHGGRIWASDIDEQAVEAARANADRAGVDSLITFAARDFAALTRGAVLGRWKHEFDEDTPAAGSHGGPSAGAGAEMPGEPGVGAGEGGDVSGEPGAGAGGDVSGEPASSPAVGSSAAGGDLPDTPAGSAAAAGAGRDFPGTPAGSTPAAGAGAEVPGHPVGGFVVTNPPYGHRLTGGPRHNDAEQDDTRIYDRLGKWLSNTMSGLTTTVLAASREQTRALGLHAKRLYKLYNGGNEIVAAKVVLSEANRYAGHRPADASRGKGAADTQPGKGVADTRPDAQPGNDAAGSDRSADEKTQTSTAGHPSVPDNGDDATSGERMIAGRLKKNRRALRPLFRQGGVSCYRLYDADIPQHAAAVDVYTNTSGETYAVIQEYAPPADIPDSVAAGRLAQLQRSVAGYLQIDEERIILKQRRRQQSGRQYASDRSRDSLTTTVDEHGMRFEVNLTDYIDTGLFSDKRIIRAQLRERAHGLRVLNLFAYTCTASVAAATGGARRTVSVDTSRTYLEWGERNFRHNRLSLKGHEFVREDTRRYLQACRERFDIIFVDPPTFSNNRSRGETFDVQRDHAELIAQAHACLSPAGEIIFTNNYRGFTLDDEIEKNFEVDVLSHATLPPDFSRSAKRHHAFRLQPRI